MHATSAAIANSPKCRNVAFTAGLLLLLVSCVGSSRAQPQQTVPLRAQKGSSFALEGRLYTFAFTEDLNALAYVNVPPPGSWPGEVRLWQRTGGREKVTTLPDTNGTVYALAFSPDGRILATGGSASADLSQKGSRVGVVKLWDAATGIERAVLQGHPSFVVTSLKFSPDGKVLVSAGPGADRKNELKLWNIANLKEVATIAGHGTHVSMLEFAPDGKTLAWGT